MARFEERDGLFHACSEGTPTIDLIYDPVTGVLTVESECLDGDLSRLTLDLTAEFYKITKRKTAEEKPPEDTYVLVGDNVPIDRLYWSPRERRWISEAGYEYIELDFKYWWPLPGGEE